MAKISTDLNPGGSYSAGVRFFHRRGGHSPVHPKPWAIAKIGIVEGNRIAHRASQPPRCRRHAEIFKTLQPNWSSVYGDF